MEAAPEYFHGGYYCGGAAAGEKQGEHFIVEDLLDLSNEQGEEETGGLGMGDDGGASGHSVDSPSAVTVVDSCSNSFSIHEQHFSGDLACRSLAGDGISGDLCEPYEELAELEWLSNIVEDSFSSDDLQKLHLISGIKSSSSSSSENISSVTTASDVAADGRTAQPAALFGPETPVPGKARSKRSRAAPCNWSSRLLVLSSTPDSSSSESNVVGAAIPANSGKKASKPAKKKDPSEGPNYAASDGRKCLHCATDKTPQWRTGPMGPKTLCNACGVRYKSGRLVPEYRPAASPTFVLSRHSNSHRKVLELRRQKELHLQLQQQQQQQQSFLHLSGGGGYDGSAGDDFLIHHHIGPDFRQLI